MRLQTILNRVERHKSFVYGAARWETDGGQRSLVIPIRPRKGSRPVCSGCGQRCGGYDTLSPRRFEFVPLWGGLVFFEYRLRRVACPQCGVRVEQVPWCDGKHRLTTSYRWFLARWARRLSWSEVAAIFGTSWDSVCRGVEHAVEWGLAHRELTGVTAVGIDEIAWRLGRTLWRPSDDEPSKSPNQLSPIPIDDRNGNRCICCATESRPRQQQADHCRPAAAEAAAIPAAS